MMLVIVVNGQWEQDVDKRCRRNDAVGVLIPSDGCCRVNVFELLL